MTAPSDAEALAALERVPHEAGCPATHTHSARLDPRSDACTICGHGIRAHTECRCARATLRAALEARQEFDAKAAISRADLKPPPNTTPRQAVEGLHQLAVEGLHQTYSYGSHSHERDAARDLVDAWAAQAKSALEARARWVPVYEGCPGEGEHVVLYEFDEFDGEHEAGPPLGTDIVLGGEFSANVTHWLDNLPPPPGEEGDTP